MPGSRLRPLNTTELVPVGRDGADLVEGNDPGCGRSDTARGDGAEGGSGESDGGHLWICYVFMCNCNWLLL